MLNSVKNWHINVQTLAKKVNVKNSAARFSVLGCVSVAKYENFPPDLITLVIGIFSSDLWKWGIF